MKPSKKAMFNYIAGSIIFGISNLLMIIQQKKTLDLFYIGAIGLCILWLIGIQNDLYEKEEKKK